MYFKWVGVANTLRVHVTLFLPQKSAQRSFAHRLFFYFYFFIFTLPNLRAERGATEIRKFQLTQYKLFRMTKKSCFSLLVLFLSP